MKPNQQNAPVDKAKWKRIKKLGKHPSQQRSGQAMLDLILSEALPEFEKKLTQAGG